MGIESTGKQSGNKSHVAGTIGRKRKVYTHAMSPNDKYALHTVQQAQNALRVINEAIKTGKKIDGKVIDLCHQINQQAGKMLFAEPVSTGTV